MINFDAFAIQPTAILYLDRYKALPKNDWAFTDLDAFYQNFELWSTGKPTIEDLFSLPTGRGLKQHLANFREKSVGIAGECLIDHKEEIIRKYLEKNYSVVIYDPEKDKVEFIENQNQKVRLMWKKN